MESLSQLLWQASHWGVKMVAWWRDTGSDLQISKSDNIFAGVDAQMPGADHRKLEALRARPQF